MRLTDEQIQAVFREDMRGADDRQTVGNVVVATVRKCLALAALPDEQKDYQDVERRGFSVSQPGELPR